MTLWTCGWLNFVLAVGYVGDAEGLPLKQHTTTSPFTDRACSYSEQQSMSCLPYRLLAVCIAPTAGGEQTLTLCFTLVSVLFVEILFGKISFPYLSPSRTLSVSLFISRGFTMFHKTLRTIQVYGIKWKCYKLPYRHFKLQRKQTRHL
jgi:hypothetical protein